MNAVLPRLPSGPCPRCGEICSPSPSQLKRRNYLCLSCRRAWDKANRARRMALGDPIKSGRMPSEWYPKYKAAYFQKPENLKRQADRQKRYSQDPQKRPRHLVRWATRREIKAGRLVRQVCEVCGVFPTDAHHDDYSAPLQVRWLCRKHHAEHHHRVQVQS